jgi:hypothetical protein
MNEGTSSGGKSTLGFFKLQCWINPRFATLNFFYDITRRHIPRDSIPQSNSREELEEFTFHCLHLSSLFIVTYKHIKCSDVWAPSCPCNEGAQTSEHLLYDCKILEAQRKALKHQIMTSGGTWPTTNSDLVAKYSHAFSRLIKSVDFYKLQ